MTLHADPPGGLVGHSATNGSSDSDPTPAPAPAAPTARHCTLLLRKQLRGTLRSLVREMGTLDGSATPPHELVSLAAPPSSSNYVLPVTMIPL
jgi:hypothetical protein